MILWAKLMHASERGGSPWLSSHALAGHIPSSRSGATCASVLSSPQPTRASVFLHGFGLPSKIIDYDIAADGLLANVVMISLGFVLMGIRLAGLALA